MHDTNIPKLAKHKNLNDILPETIKWSIIHTEPYHPIRNTN